MPVCRTGKILALQSQGGGTDWQRDRVIHRSFTNGRMRSSQKSHIKYLARAQDRQLKRGMKTTPKTRPGNVTSFILEGRWPLAGFDQQELRRLSKTAKRYGVGVADVLYEAVESFVATCEAEADLEEKVIKFPKVAKGGSATDR